MPHRIGVSRRPEEQKKEPGPYFSHAFPSILFLISTRCALAANHPECFPNGSISLSFGPRKNKWWASASPAAPLGSIDGGWAKMASQERNRHPKCECPQ